MISLTGGFNQQFQSGTLELRRAKSASDGMSFTDAFTFHLFRTRMLFTDSLTLTDAVTVTLG